MGEDRLAALAVPDRAALQVAADRDAHDHRARERAVRPPARGGGLRLDLVHRRPHVVEELDLRARSQPADRLADRPADDVRLGERRVEAAGVAERALQPERDAEHAALARDLVDDVGSASATSSPNTRMRSSRAICSCSVSRIASPNVTTSASARVLRLARDRRRRASGPNTCSVTVAGSGRRRGERLLGRGARPPPWLRRGSRRLSSVVSAPIVDQLLLEHGDRVVLRFVLRARRARGTSSGRRRASASTGRVTIACTRHGPAPARTRAIASAPLRAHLEVVAAVHLHDVQPADAAHHLRDRRRCLVGRTARRSRSRCRRRRRARGRCSRHAVFSDSQNSPSDVAPSPSDT